MSSPQKSPEDDPSPPTTWSRGDTGVVLGVFAAIICVVGVGVSSRNQAPPSAQDQRREMIAEALAGRGGKEAAGGSELASAYIARRVDRCHRLNRSSIPRRRRLREIAEEVALARSEAEGQAVLEALLPDMSPKTIKGK